MSRCAFLLVSVFSFVFSAFAQAPARPPITGIAFMRVYTTDLPAAKAFYGKTLGLSEGQSGQDALFAVNQHQWVELQAGAPPEPNSRLAAIGLATPNVAAMRRYLESRNVAVEDRAQAGELAVHDPEGNLVVFVQPGDTGPEARFAAHVQALPSATSRRIIHVGFIARDRAKEDAFWRAVLGFRPYWHGGMTPDRDDWVSMQVPDGSDWIEYMLGQSEHPSLQQAGVMNHFSLGTTDMRRVLAQLQRNGCTERACTSIQVGRDGKIQLNLFDPDRTRVEFMEFTPVLEPCCSTFTAAHPHP